MRFATWDAKERRWVKEGMTLSIRVEGLEGLATYDVDYSPLSGCLLMAGGVTSPRRSPVLIIKPARSAFSRNAYHAADVMVILTWIPQDKNGGALAVSRQAVKSVRYVFLPEGPPKLGSAANRP